MRTLTLTNADRRLSSSARRVSVVSASGAVVPCVNYGEGITYPHVRAGQGHRRQVGDRRARRGDRPDMVAGRPLANGTSPEVSRRDKEVWRA